MKKLILNRRQFLRLNEDIEAAGAEEMPLIDVAADDMSDVPNIGKEAAQKIAASGAKAAKVTVFPKGTDINDTIEIKGTGDTIEDQLQNATEASASSGMDKNMTSFTATLGPNGKPIGESRTYSKKQIEEARFKKLNENMQIFSKKDLNSFLKNM